jgi:putative flippase GtrA
MVNKLKLLSEKRAFRYVTSGGGSFVVEYGSFIVFFYLVQLSPVVSNTISYILSLITSFLLNKYWVFRGGQQQRRISHQLAIFGVMASWNLLFTDVAIHWLISRDVEAFVAKMILIVIVASWNFLLFQKLIFKSHNTTVID